MVSARSPPGVQPARRCPVRRSEPADVDARAAARRDVDGRSGAVRGRVSRGVRLRRRAIGTLCLLFSPVALAIVFCTRLPSGTRRTRSCSWRRMAVRASAADRRRRPGRARAMAARLHRAVGGGFDILMPARRELTAARASLDTVRFGVGAAIVLSRCCTSPRWPRWLRCGASRNTAVVPAGVAVVGSCWRTISRSFAKAILEVKRAFDLNGYVGIIYFR